MKEDYQAYTSKLYYYYLEFLSRSKKYQAELDEHYQTVQDLKGTPFKLLPAKIVLSKKKKPLKPQELKKPVICPSGSSKGQGVWNITPKFTCQSNRLILEVDIEKPVKEVLLPQIKEIIKPAHEQYWKEMNDENWFGEYRYLVDFRKDIDGRKIRNLFDGWDNFLRVYDLKTEGKTDKEIAILILKQKNIALSEETIKKNYQKAKRHIKAAEENKFPPRPRSKKPKISPRQ